MLRTPGSVAALLVAATIVLAGCGGAKISAPSAPEGRPLLPDLAPAPPEQVHMTRKRGHWYLNFDSSMVNVGAGPLVLRAVRKDGRWQVVQDVMYSKSGGRSTALRATMVWGGDGHNHWHIARVAVNNLVRTETGQKPALAGGGRVDAKVGFCFFDYHHVLANGPADAVYSRHDCGHRDDTTIRMGLSPGWVDTYPWVLPGQSVDVDDLADGRYRLWATVDEKGWFREASSKNDVTWADIELSTAKGLRYARVVAVGPRPHRAT